LPPGPELSKHQAEVLLTIAYFQPVTRGDLTQIFGREISRDTIAALRQEGLIAAGPRSPQPGAPYTYVTTNAFLSLFRLNGLADLPNMEQLEEAGLLSKQKLLTEGNDVFSAMLARAEEDTHDEQETEECEEYEAEHN
jgi:segregation and condensation protein B